MFNFNVYYFRDRDRWHEKGSRELRMDRTWKRPIPDSVFRRIVANVKAQNAKDSAQVEPWDGALPAGCKVVE
jgi:hypothetical protein